MNYKITDLHCDTIYHLVKGKDITKDSKNLQASIPQLKKGEVNIQLFAVFVDPKRTKKEGYYNYTKRALNKFLEFVKENKNNIEIAKTTKDIKNISAKKIAAVLSLESGHIIEGEIKKLREFYNLGVRSLTITWNNSNQLATSAFEAKKFDGGLTTFGKKIIKEMNKLGMLIDVSHCSEKTFWDILKISRTPIIASHSNAKNLCNHFRNLSDKQITAIARNGGVIGINFHNKFLKEDYKNTTIKDVIKHIVYIKNLVGINHLAFGSDYDGFIKPPQGLENAGKFPLLIKEFKKNKFTEKEIKKICGENFLRVMNEVKNKIS